jgi:hypothetical protein
MRGARTSETQGCRSSRLVRARPLIASCGSSWETRDECCSPGWLVSPLPALRMQFPVSAVPPPAPVPGGQPAHLQLRQEFPPRHHPRVHPRDHGEPCPAAQSAPEAAPAHLNRIALGVCCPPLAALSSADPGVVAQCFGALLFAKLLSIPIVMSYHTHVPKYIPQYTFSFLVEPMWAVISKPAPLHAGRLCSCIVQVEAPVLCVYAYEIPFFLRKSSLESETVRRQVQQVWSHGKTAF